jgi:allantoin racemase
MKIKVVNPNTTAAFTARNVQIGRAVAAAGTEIIAAQAAAGADSIEGHCDEAVAVIGILEEIMNGEQEGVDGYVIACFGDPGVHAAREIARGPVVGMTEAALYAAALVADGFSIVTLPARTRIHAERVVRETGMSQRCRSIRAIDVPVLDFELPDESMLEELTRECRLALSEDRAEGIVLGCAGLADQVPRLASKLAVPVVEGVAAAVKMVEGLVALGLGTSKIGSYGFPVRKSYSGSFASLSPARQNQRR